MAQLTAKANTLEQHRLGNDAVRVDPVPSVKFWQASASSERNTRLVNEAHKVRYLIFILSVEILAGGSSNGSEEGA